MPLINRRRELSIGDKISAGLVIVLSMFSGLAAFLFSVWSFLRERFTLSQLKGVAGSVGSMLMTFLFSAILVWEIHQAVTQNREGKFRPDLEEVAQTEFYNRYLFHRFFLLVGYAMATVIAIGEIFALLVGGAALAPVLLPSFVLGVFIFTVCQVVEIIRLKDEWRHEINWGKKAKLESQIISTWIGLALLLAGGVVGFSGFSIVSIGLLIASSVVLVLKIVNALTTKEPIQSLFGSFGVSLFPGNEYHARQIYGPAAKKVEDQEEGFYFEMMDQYPPDQDEEDNFTFTKERYARGGNKIYPAALILSSEREEDTTHLLQNDGVRLELR